MLYTTKAKRIEKAAMNNADNKAVRKTFVDDLEAHFKRGDMIVFQDETNFNLYLSRNHGCSREGERAVVQLPAPKGKNLHVQGGVSSETGLVLLKTHQGSVTKVKMHNLLLISSWPPCRRRSSVSSNLVVVMDNAPAHNDVDVLARAALARDGVINGNRLVISYVWLHTAPCLTQLRVVGVC
ncbi:unnamed protein product [Phytophthora fragariaefolia]|uniref:Unnamed protein product n=1 Tax=Phytophthora fragariaefolia TaxID=1490495 RepID=A0A9W6YC66_9STRA|nr:unnamed protein product [Phytophthora fragariaefolia]